MGLSWAKLSHNWGRNIDKLNSYSSNTNCDRMGLKVVIWSLDRSENVVQLLGDFQSEIVQDPDKSWIIFVKMARKLEKD